MYSRQQGRLQGVIVAGQWNSQEQMGEHCVTMEYCLLGSDHLIGNGQWRYGGTLKNLQNNEIVLCHSNQIASLSHTNGNHGFLCHFEALLTG